MAEQLYQLKIEAAGEVRDADGNLISTHPITIERTLTETQVLEQIGTLTDLKES